MRGFGWSLVARSGRRSNPVPTPIPLLVPQLLRSVLYLRSSRSSALTDGIRFQASTRGWFSCVADKGRANIRAETPFERLSELGLLKCSVTRRRPVLSPVTQFSSQVSTPPVRSSKLSAIDGKGL
jgi:hypothetical protein